MTKRIEDALKELYEAFKEEQTELGNIRKFPKDPVPKDKVKLYAYRHICFGWYPQTEELGNKPYFFMRMTENDFPDKPMRSNAWEAEDIL